MGKARVGILVANPDHVRIAPSAVDVDPRARQPCRLGMQDRAKRDPSGHAWPPLTEYDAYACPRKNDRLARRGLVERRDHPTDRRARLVHLTAAGRRLIARAFTDH